MKLFQNGNWNVKIWCQSLQKSDQKSLTTPCLWLLYNNMNTEFKMQNKNFPMSSHQQRSLLCNSSGKLKFMAPCTDKYKGRVRLPGVFCARPRGIELVFHVKFHFVKIRKSLLAGLKALPDDRNLCSIRCCCWPLPPAVEADWPMQMLGQPRGDGSWPLFIVNDYTLLRACWNVVHFYIIIVLSGTYSEPAWMKIIIFLEVWNEKSKEIGIWGCWFKLFISMFVWGGKLGFNYYFREQFGHFLKEKFVCN